MFARRLPHKLLVAAVALGLSLAPLQPALLLSLRVEAQGVASVIGAAGTGLYRTHVLVRTARDRARLEELGVVVLGEDDERRATMEGGGISLLVLVPPDQWADRLFKARQAFLNAIGTYMAWNWHEQRPGEMDFTDGRDLDRWLRLIEEQGLYIIARPGPYICSEWDFGGFPGWLAAAPREMRSLDPAYMEPCTRWLEAVDRIIAPHQLGQGGRVILYQIENEYFWGDLPYHLCLKQLAEEHGITVPIVTNENKATRGSPIIETPDPYPRHVWDVLFPEYAVRELRAMQPDKPPFGMEVQGGFFSMTGAPFTAYSRFAGGSIDPGWTDVYIKTLIAAGLNGVNYYMFHGGTNFGRFAGKYMTTTYDFDAAVREWGELSDRYYVIRRLGGFLASLGEALVSTDPVADSGQPMDLGVQVLARQGNGMAFLFPRNLHARAGDDALLPASPDRPDVLDPASWDVYRRAVQHELAADRDAVARRVDPGTHYLGGIARRRSRYVGDPLRNAPSPGHARRPARAHDRPRGTRLGSPCLRRAHRPGCLL